MNQYQNPPRGMPSNPGQGGAQTAPAGGDDGAVNLGAVLSGMRQRKLLMFLIFSVIVSAAAAFVFTATPKYTAVSKVLVGSPATNYRGPNLGQNQQRAAERVDALDVRSQVEVVQSRDIAVRVAKQLNLSQLREFNGSGAAPSPLQKVKAMLGFASKPSNESIDQKVVNKLVKNLTVFPVLRSKVIQVEYESTNPKVSAAVANTFTKLYVKWTQEIQLDDTRGATNWLTDQIGRLQQTVTEQEAAVENFRAQAGLIRGQSQTSTLAQDELSELNRQIALAAAARAEAEAKADAIRRMLKETGSVAASNDVINSNLIQRLREQEIALARRMAELKTTYLSSHPRILSARQEIRDVRREIRVEALKIVEGLEQQAAVTSAREASLRASLDELKSKSSVSKRDEVQLRALERKAKASRDQLEMLLTRRTDASSRQDIVAQAPGARIIASAAVPSKPSFPKTVPTLVVAMGGGLAIALLIAFLLEAINPRHRQASSLAVAPQVVPQEQAASEASSGGLVSGQDGPRLDLAGALPDQHSPEPVIPAAPPVQRAPEPVVAPAQSAHAQLAKPYVLPAAASQPATPPAVVTSMAPPQPVDIQPATPVAVAPPAPATRDMSVIASLGAMPGDVAASSYAVVSTPDAPYATAMKQMSRDIASKLGHLTDICIYVSPVSDPASGAAVSAGLARSFSGFGLKTLVIDATFANSEFLHAFGIGSGFGLMEFLNGQITFSDAIVSDGSSAAHIMTSGLAGADGLAALAPDRLDLTFKALLQAYDVVIISGPSVPENLWISSVANMADFTLLVAAEEAGHDAAVASCQQLAGVTTSDIGIVLAGAVAQAPAHAA